MSPPAGSVRLSKRVDGTPEFMFLKYTSDETDAPQGGLLHFLVEWGLTATQEEELQTKLQEKLNNPNAKVIGSVPVRADYNSESGTFQIISGTLSDNKSMQKGSAATIEGGKTAVAAKLDKYMAALLEATFTENSSISDVSLEFKYTFPLQIQAAQGNIRVDKERYHFVKDSLSKEYTYKGWSFWFWERREKTYDEVRKLYEILHNTNVIQCDFIEGANVPEEKMKVVRDAFFNTFLNNHTTPASELPKSLLEESGNPGEEIDIKSGRSYVLNVDIEKESRISSKDEIKLNWRMSVDFPLHISGNLKSWYDEVKDNPKCISSVNISHPFFERPEIRVILDVNTRKIFGENINHASVKIRKGAKEKSITFDSESVKNGFVQAVTFGREPGDDSRNYQYKYSWNIGGNFEEENMGWQTADDPVITLAPPIAPRTIKLQANQADLEEAGIPNVTAEIRYRKFNQEQQTELDLFGQSSYSNQKVIFVDQSSRAFAYRLVYHHKEHGDLATEWKEKNNEYIYAGVPKKLLDKEVPFINKMKYRFNEFKDVKGGIMEILNEFGELKELFK